MTYKEPGGMISNESKHQKSKLELTHDEDNAQNDFLSQLQVQGPYHR